MPSFILPSFGLYKMFNKMGFGSLFLTPLLLKRVDTKNRSRGLSNNSWGRCGFEPQILVIIELPIQLIDWLLDAIWVLPGWRGFILCSWWIIFDLFYREEDPSPRPSVAGQAHPHGKDFRLFRPIRSQKVILSPSPSLRFARGRYVEGHIHWATGEWFKL